MSGVKRSRDNLDMLATAACDVEDYEWQAYLLRQRVEVLRKNNDELRDRLHAALRLIEFASEAVRDRKLAERRYGEAAIVVQCTSQQLLKK